MLFLRELRGFAFHLLCILPFLFLLRHLVRCFQNLTILVDLVPLAVKAVAVLIPGDKSKILVQDIFCNILGIGALFPFLHHHGHRNLRVIQGGVSDKGQVGIRLFIIGGFGCTGLCRDCNRIIPKGGIGGAVGIRGYLPHSLPYHAQHVAGKACV